MRCRHGVGKFQFIIDERKVLKNELNYDVQIENCYDHIGQEHQNLWRRRGPKYENSALKIQEIVFQGRKNWKNCPGYMPLDPLG